MMTTYEWRVKVKHHEHDVQFGGIVQWNKLKVSSCAHTFFWWTIRGHPWVRWGVIKDTPKIKDTISTIEIGVRGEWARRKPPVVRYIMTMTQDSDEEWIRYCEHQQKPLVILCGWGVQLELTDWSERTNERTKNKQTNKQTNKRANPIQPCRANVVTI